MTDFKTKHKEIQIAWRKKHITNNVYGLYNKIKYEHIIPMHIWEENLWPGIRNSLPKYIKQNNIKPHTGKNNLLSSWVVSANLYFPLQQDASLSRLMLAFLQQKISAKIKNITDVTLEFAFPLGDSLHPSTLLGELDGNRGSGQTSPDLAIIVETKNGKGIILTECKFTEHSFYRCSARRTIDRGIRKGNPHPEKCLQNANSCNYKNICHQTVWGRKYWSLLNLSTQGKKILNRCPAATAGYQLFRQHALAEGIMNSGKYDIVASSVAFDDRNDSLKNCLRRTGISDFQTEWAPVFTGKTLFKTWTHQEWVQFVRDNQTNGAHDDWLKYLEERYGY